MKRIALAILTIATVLASPAFAQDVREAARKAAADKKAAATPETWGQAMLVPSRLI